MATIMQKKLAANISKNGRAAKPLNKTQLLESSGYSAITAKASANVILNQKGVQEELKTLGFTEDNAKLVVAEILNDKFAEPSDRLKAGDMVFKVNGTYAPEKKLTVNVDINELQTQIQSQIAQFRGLVEPSNDTSTQQ